MLRPSGWDTSRFIEGRTTRKNGRDLRDLASAIGDVNLPEVGNKVLIGLATGLAAVVGGAELAHAGEILYHPPCATEILVDYGSRRDAEGLLFRHPYQSIAIQGNTDDPVLAAANGRVLASHKSSDFGWRIVIEHGQDSDGSFIRTVYALLGKNIVEKGDYVKRGQKIAEIGASGSKSPATVRFLEFTVYRGPTQRYSNNWTDVNPHDYWYDGKNRITCFDPNREYSNLPIGLTYPVPRDLKAAAKK